MRGSYLLLLVVGMSFMLVRAGELPAPPPLAEMPVSLQHYLQKIYEHMHKPPIVTANPNGSRRGDRGELVYATFGGSNRLCANTSTSMEGGTSWECVTLSSP